MIELRNISKRFREPNGQWRVLFDGLDFRLPDEPSLVAIMGRSGSGKTTLLNILTGLDCAYEGSYYWNEERIDANDATMSSLRRAEFGVVTQGYDLLHDRNVQSNVEIGDIERRGRAARARACLSRVGLKGFACKKPQELSGGEAQRAALARALVKRPRVVFADEPTGALDERTERTILDLFLDVKQAGASVVVATHSHDVAAVCDEVYAIERARLRRVR